MAKNLKKHLREINQTLDCPPLLQHEQFTDTDPQMLFAICAMELGIDPEESLDEVKFATVSYDKFAPRVSRRKVTA